MNVSAQNVSPTDHDSSSVVPSRTRLYKELASVLARHAGKALGDNLGVKFVDFGEADSGIVLAEDLEELGPTFVKLGQLLSTRTDLFPAATIAALERLQDDVEPVPYEEIAMVLEESLGGPPERLFRSFEIEPLASASLGQVHRAVLHTGEKVIVKIQRPSISKRVEEELEVLREVSRTLEKHSEKVRRVRLCEIVEELSYSLTRELDYRLELENLRAFGEMLADSHRLFVPKPYPRYCSQQVLTMDYVVGDKLPSEPLVGHSSAALLADELFRTYLEHVLLVGRFHADPHPGNLLLTPGGRLCLLDLGMLGNMPKSLQVTLAHLILAIVEEDGEMAAEIALDVSGRSEVNDEPGFRSEIATLVADYHQRPIAQIQAGGLIMEIVQIAHRRGVILPYELTMLAKTLMNLDEIGRRLDPEFNPTEAMEKSIKDILQRRLKKDFNSEALLSSYLEARTFLKDGPRLANNILRDLAQGTFTVRVDALDERELLVAFQKIANRIGMSLMVGALIMGAAMLMGTDVDGPTLWGYPAFAMVAFCLAFGGGMRIAWSVYTQDREPRRNPNELNR